MDPNRISELLQPFLKGEAISEPVALTPEQLQAISTYIDLILRWNARINLTAVRDPDAIIARHFGESLFLAACLLPGHIAHTVAPEFSPQHALDFGSGAGFPGLPLKICAPQLQLTLVESNQKKAAFLNEVVRALGLKGAKVISERIEARLMQEGDPKLPPGIPPADLVTMRAVEHFESALNTAAALIRASSGNAGRGKLALLIGQKQAHNVSRLVADFFWNPPVQVPQSRERVLLVGQYSHSPAPEK